MTSEAQLRFGYDGQAYRVTCDAAPGWAVVARTPVELARAVERGLTEAQIAEYAARREQPYDLALHDEAAREAAETTRRPLAHLAVDEDVRAAQIAAMACSVPQAQPQTRHVGHDPLAWTPLPDGTWRSPAGRIYGGETRIVQGVIERRARSGIGTV